MTPSRIAAVVVFASLAALAIGPQQSRQRPTFRAGTDVVTITAFVRQGNLTVPGLTPADFIVTDNDVRQTVDVIPGESVPFDMTLALDLSGSIEGMLDQLRGQVREAADLLRPDDRVRVVTFSGRIVDVFGFLPGTADLPMDDFYTGNLTPLYDTMAMTMLRLRPADRGQIIVFLTDGVDTSSTFTLARVQTVALRSEDVLYMFIVHRGPNDLPIPHELVDTRQYWWPQQLDFISGGPPTQLMGDVARTTGGDLYEIWGRDHIPASLKQAIDDFRASYILQYTVQGVSPKGRHKMSVKLNRPGNYDIRARRQYDGG
ncbi:MAG: hypothetical protein ACHQO8_03455 [Vicinamibacterales bacterium]